MTGKRYPWPMTSATDSSRFTDESFFGSGESMVVGHRGDPRRYRENSLAGIMAALDVVGAAEVDVRMTADGQLVLSHDPELGGRMIAGSRWDELADRRVDGYPPCLLEEILAVPGRLDLEVKNFPFEENFDDRGRLALMVASRARPGDVVTSFYWPDMDLIRERAPRVATGLLVADEATVEGAVAHAHDRGHDAIVPEDPLVDADLCAAAAAAGLAVMTWTVNDPLRARELYQLGVAAIISDCPQEIREQLPETNP